MSSSAYHKKRNHWAYNLSKNTRTGRPEEGRRGNVMITEEQQATQRLNIRESSLKANNF
jgi:hypothetical protein